MARVTRSILAINCGSSSLKFGLYGDEDGALKLLLEGAAEEVGTGNSTFWWKTGEDGAKKQETPDLRDHEAAIEQALRVLRESGIPGAQAIGHRVVHGGLKVRRHQVLTPQVLQDLESAVTFAPLHVPAAVAAIKAVAAREPDMPQVVCLDTAFHESLPDVSHYFALPRQISDSGVVRFGFHGLSIESILRRVNSVPKRVVVAHLGGGCSVTAILEGKSIDTSMGLTPTGGMMMGTRCGDLDPGVLVYLMRNGFDTPEKLEQLVGHDSGLSGISGIGSDLRKIDKARSENRQADLAHRMFVYQLRKAIGAMVAILGGLDLLIFSGGIGEHNEQVRAEVLQGLSFLGSFASQAIPSQEDLEIATITSRLAF